MESVPQLSIMKGRICPRKPAKIYEIFEEIAKKSNGRSAAVIFEENQLSYREMDSLSNSLARAIIDQIKNHDNPRNVDGDCIIAVSIAPSHYLIVMMLAILKAGSAYLPLDPDFPQIYVEQILSEARPAIIISDKNSGQFLNTPQLSLTALLEFGEKYYSSPLKQSERQNHVHTDLAIVLYTSGSTGVPKGVKLHNSMILNRLEWQFNAFPYSDTESICAFKTAPTFVDSVSEIWGPLMCGLSLLIISKHVTRNPELLLPVLGKYKIERLVLVPSLLKSILIYINCYKDHQFLHHLKIWICSGEILSGSLVQQFYQHFSISEHKLCNMYGSTELMGDVSYHIISDLNDETVSIGLPIDNTIIYLLDPEFRPVKVGEVGEIYVAGANLAAGYVNGRNSDKFVENPFGHHLEYAQLYRTGDLARIRKGVLVYEGRIDSQIKILGHRVDLSGIQSSVDAIDGVEKNIILPYNPGALNQALIAFVIPKAGVNGDRIEKLLAAKFPRYMVPQVILLDDIPLLTNGKVNRQELLKLYENVYDQELQIDYTEITEEQMPMAKVLFESVASVIHKSARGSISIRANFFEIGGNSLNTVCIITSLSEKGYHISISDFVAAKNLGEILNRIFTNRQEFNQSPCYSTELLGHQHKDDVANMVRGFYKKGDLDRWIASQTSESDYVDVLEQIWTMLVEMKLSFIVRTKMGEPVGVSLNYDVRKEPSFVPYSKLSIIFEFLQSIEFPIRDSYLPLETGKTMQSYVIATSSTLTHKENVMVVQFIEGEVINMARRNGFEGVFTTNSNPLTQQLCTDIYLYKTYLECQVNQYIASDGSKPFALAPDSQKSLVQWRAV